MGMFLIYAAKQEQRNSSQINSVLVEAATEEAARAAAVAQAPLGCVVRDSWLAVELGAGEFPDSRTACFFQGRGPISFLGLDSGGNVVP